MSLQIWMPFNSLAQQGLCGESCTNTGVALASGGKTAANCANFESGDYLVIPNTNFFTTTTKEMSIAFWIKSTATSNMALYCNRTSTGSGIALFKLGSTFRFDAGVQTSFTAASTYSEWTHLVFTWDGSIKKFYVNGVLSASSACTTAPSNIGTVSYIGASVTSTTAGGTIGNPYIGQLNDYRVYDHCLSLKEIRELSMGLALHYKLEGRGKTNYLVGSANYSYASPLVRKASDSSSMNDSYIYYNVSSFYVSVPTDGTYTWILESDGVPSGHATTGTTASERRFSMWVQNTSTSTHYCWTGYGTDANGRHYGSVTIPAGTYKIRINLYAADSVDYTVNMWNMKFIAGSYDVYDTWCPNVADAMYAAAGYDKETDCSGFGNHGTKGGTIDIASDSARYKRCSVFTGTEYVAAGRGAMITDALTVSLWAYMDDWTTFTRAASCTEGGGWNFEPSSGYLNFAMGTGSSSNTYKSVTSSLAFSSMSGWHMLTGTYDGYSTKIYIDGVLKGTNSAYTTKTPIYYNSANGIFVGAEAASSATTPGGSYFVGSISDFRIYGTALSAEDILNLYNVGGAVDKQQSIYSYEYIEEDDSTPNLGMNGSFIAPNITESSASIGAMKIKTLSDKSAWARIHWLDVTDTKTWFTVDEVDYCDESNRYSKMKDVDTFVNSSGVYEFMLTYPSLSSTLYNRWTQTSSPTATTVTGFTAITTAWSAHNAGIRKNGSSCVYNCDSGSTWYAPIGQTATWSTTQYIPAADGSSQTETELWVRIDTLDDATKVGIYADQIQSYSFYEI